MLASPQMAHVDEMLTYTAVGTRELVEMGTQIILGNTHHLSIRPGMDIIRAAGGLHAAAWCLIWAIQERP
mgnify:CR=1 FL=1